MPASIAVVETHTLLDRAVLRGSEADAVSRAFPKRRREFSTGRACAREALAELGFDGAAECAIGVGSGREPRFPAEVVGSISHCEGAVVAASAWRRDILSVGIDVEVRRELSAEQAAAVTLPEELGGPDTHTHLPVALFAAREACYKLWYPVAQEWLGFHDVRVHLDAGGERFTVSFLGAYAPLAQRLGVTAVVGGIAWSERQVYAAAWIRATS